MKKTFIFILLTIFSLSFCLAVETLSQNTFSFTAYKDVEASPAVGNSFTLNIIPYNQYTAIPDYGVVVVEGDAFTQAAPEKFFSWELTQTFAYENTGTSYSYELTFSVDLLTATYNGIEYHPYYELKFPQNTDPDVSVQSPVIYRRRYGTYGSYYYYTRSSTISLTTASTATIGAGSTGASDFTYYLDISSFGDRQSTGTDNSGAYIARGYGAIRITGLPAAVENQGLTFTGLVTVTLTTS